MAQIGEELTLKVSVEDLPIGTVVRVINECGSPHWVLFGSRELFLELLVINCSVESQIGTLISVKAKRIREVATLNI